jgi:preprotein translocase subunit SecA
MSTANLLALQPGDVAAGRPYAERHEHEPPWHDQIALRLWYGATLPLLRRTGRHRRVSKALIAHVERHAAEFSDASDDQLRMHARALRAELRAQGFVREPVARCFALVREAAQRVLGKRHYETQLTAGWWLLQGSLVEMATGEGKTFAATLPACTAALAGLPVHVITVNDYLAARDAEAMGPLYRFFGLRCSAIVHGMQRPERRAAYAGDITYASNKELAFDYLRDRSALGDRASLLHLAAESLRDGRARSDATVLRGLSFGIVDEADSVFIDEARTPLILSATAGGAAERGPCERALQIARSLEEGSDYLVDHVTRRVRVLDAGHDELERLDDEGGDSPWHTPAERAENIERALSALHLYARDRQYVVVDGKVQIVDESTGRVMPDRAWERGLHQMIEAKEGVALTEQRETLARITYQRLFRRYLRLAGMSGTAMEVSAEIGRTYGLPVVRVPLHKPSRRVVAAPRCLRDASAKWRAVADAVERQAVHGKRPVLIGTRTVEASEAISSVLQARGIEHVVLNAKQDGDEAHIIAEAGRAGRVTVATNMAGRGTDIALGEGVAEHGGLHVILTEYHESRRIDRQLLGRCARQGDPGSCEVIVALDDELFRTHAPLLARWVGRRHEAPAKGWTGLLRRAAQWAAERRNAATRMHTLKHDRYLSRMLAFSGRGE